MRSSRVGAHSRGGFFQVATREFMVTASDSSFRKASKGYAVLLTTIENKEKQEKISVVAGAVADAWGEQMSGAIGAVVGT